jgi:hypothetical protein
MTITQYFNTSAPPVSSGRVTRSRASASTPKSPRRSTRSQTSNESDNSKPDLDIVEISTNKINSDVEPVTKNKHSTRVTRRTRQTNSDSGSESEGFSGDKGGSGSDDQIKPRLKSIAEIEMNNSSETSTSDVAMVETPEWEPEFKATAVDTAISDSETTSSPRHSTENKYAHLNLNKISAKRGGDFSFAPNDFAFKAPENLNRLSFIPLSPASTAEFMFCGGQSHSSPAFR